MTWTDPRTWVVGEKVRAADMNANLRDNLNFLYERPRVALRRSTNLTVPDSTFVVVPWDTVVRDNAGWFDPGSPTVVVVPRDGEYVVNFPHVWGASGVGVRQNRLLRDTGTGWEALRGDRIMAAPFTERSPFWVTDLLAGWSLGVEVQQTSGANLDVEARVNPIRSPLLIVSWFGPLS